MHTLRLVAVVASLAAPIVAAAGPQPTAAFNPAIWDGGPRVRTYDERSATILLDGIRRSETFRAVIEALEHRDLIVYVQIQPSLKSRLAGMMTWLCATKRFRYVRVGLSPELRGDAAIATLGHELQHALEVANAPSIVDTRSLHAHYQQVGISMRSHNNGWDTEAARQIGDDVRRDLAVTGASAFEAVRDFDPKTWPILYRTALESR